MNRQTVLAALELKATVTWKGWAVVGGDNNSLWIHHAGDSVYEASPAEIYQMKIEGKNNA